MLTDDEIYAESEKRYPVPEQTRIPVDQADIDLAKDLQTAFEYGAEWAREQLSQENLK